MKKIHIFPLESHFKRRNNLDQIIEERLSISHYIEDVKNLSVTNSLKILHNWLKAKANSISFNRECIVHGDLYFDNIIVSSDGLYVIDWTFARIADIRFDLGWIKLLNYLEVGDELSGKVYSEYVNSLDLEINNEDFFFILSCFRFFGGISVMLKGADHSIISKIKTLLNDETSSNIINKIFTITGIKLEKLFNELFVILTE